jgi:di/tricarboxylate transporter
MTNEIALVLAVLAGTVVLFITEALRVDIIALLVMLVLAWLRLVTPAQAVSGLASNAVISIIGVMIIGNGLERSGVTNRLVKPIIRLSGSRERGIIAVTSLAVGTISSFMQNIGATAVFLPAVKRISRKLDIPLSRLLMPLGFAAILGGTLTLVGSGPLIILNDLLKQGGQATYSLFSVTPVGAVLLLAGVLYFVALGRRVLPVAADGTASETAQQRIIETWHIPVAVHGCTVPGGSRLVGKTNEEVDLWGKYNLNLLALREGDDVTYAPWRFTRFAEGQELIILGNKDDVERCVAELELNLEESSALLEQIRGGVDMGFAELIVPPKSSFAGKTIRDLAVRKTYGVEPIMIIEGGDEVRGDISDIVLRPGSTIVVYGHWQMIRDLADRRRLVPISPIESAGVPRPKPVAAVVCFAGAIGLVLAGAPISVSLLSGAVAMVLLGVLSIDDAYQAVDWRTVFLLAGLIPLGIAVDQTGGAMFIADKAAAVLQGAHPVWIFFAVAVLATLFSLFMSNVAATVLLVPLVMMMGRMAGTNPRALALLVAVCASNSFVLPTHQVNALLMGPGGYHNKDYIRAGGVMTLLFLVIAVLLIYTFYA